MKVKRYANAMKSWEVTSPENEDDIRTVLEDQARAWVDDAASGFDEMRADLIARGWPDPLKRVAVFSDGTFLTDPAELPERFVFVGRGADYIRRNTEPLTADWYLAGILGAWADLAKRADPSVLEAAIRLGVTIGEFQMQRFEPEVRTGRKIRSPYRAANERRRAEALAKHRPIVAYMREQVAIHGNVSRAAREAEVRFGGRRSEHRKHWYECTKKGVPGQ